MFHFSDTLAVTAKSAQGVGVWSGDGLCQGISRQFPGNGLFCKQDLLSEEAMNWMVQPPPLRLHHFFIRNSPIFD